MRKPKLTTKVIRGLGSVISIAETEGSVFFSENSPVEDTKQAYKEWESDSNDFDQAILYLRKLREWYNEQWFKKHTQTK